MRRKIAVIRSIVIIWDSAFYVSWFGLSEVVFTLFQKRKACGIAKKMRKSEKSVRTPGRRPRL